METSTELKHQARLQEWAVAIQDCRSSGLSVRQWCRERGTTPTTYYRWERELLSIAGSTKPQPETPAVAFAELPVPKQVCCNTPERSATLRVGNFIRKCQIIRVAPQFTGGEAVFCLPLLLNFQMSKSNPWQFLGTFHALYWVMAFSFDPQSVFPAGSLRAISSGA